MVEIADHWLLHTASWGIWGARGYRGRPCLEDWRHRLALSFHPWTWSLRLYLTWVLNLFLFLRLLQLFLLPFLWESVLGQIRLDQRNCPTICHHLRSILVWFDPCHVWQDQIWYSSQMISNIWQDLLWPDPNWFLPFASVSSHSNIVCTHSFDKWEAPSAYNRSSTQICTFTWMWWS